MRSRPRDDFGDLRGACFARDHRQIRNPHEHLKIRRHDVKVRWPMIVGINAHTHGAEPVDGRYP
jgi:hypothetical protein